MELFLSAHLNPNPRPSAWTRRHAGLIPTLGSGARVLDLACGSGRHVRWLAARGAQVTAVDRDAAALATLHGVAAEVMLADIENGPWPLPGRTFDAVVVTNYLWRPLMPWIVASVAPGGVLLYETFAHGNASVGKPSRPDFLLQPGELLDRVRPELRVVAYEDGFLDGPPRFLQRIAAVRQTSTDTSANPARWPLHDS
ncbi:class I SAM-dependent methyltransferase [Sphaerotilus montanus]|uniref:class I SAM-dependent methyltransferase n=1 Tax=Sphaerotilus montanus TaxID=522889 RepID=UPI003FA33855